MGVFCDANFNSNLLCTTCRNPSLGLVTKARGCKVASQEKNPGTLHMLPGVQRVWGNEPSHSQVNSHVRSWTPERTPESSKRDCRGQNSLSRRVLYISGKLLKCRIGSHCSFRHLKHKLWEKERSGIKLAVWLSTIKSRESTQFPCVQATCDLPLESSRRGLQLCFKLHRDQRSAQEVMCLQSHGNPSWCNFGTPSWESRDKKPFGCGPREEVQSIL